MNFINSGGFPLKQSRSRNGCGFVPALIPATTINMHGGYSWESGACPNCGGTNKRRHIFGICREWLCLYGIPVWPCNIQTILICSECKSVNLIVINSDFRNELISFLRTSPVNRSILGRGWELGTSIVIIVAVALLAGGLVYLLSSNAIAAFIAFVVGWLVGAIFAAGLAQTTNPIPSR